MKTYDVTLTDGKITNRKLIKQKNKAKPINKIVLVGTRKAPPVPRTGVLGYIADKYGANWAALARCESGGRPNAVSSNGLYHGLYQFSVGTWHAVGGSGLPSNASASEQTARAKMLYNRSGAGQWPHCGKNLFS